MSDIGTELEVVVENLCHFLWFSNVFFSACMAFKSTSAQNTEF